MTQGARKELLLLLQKFVRCDIINSPKIQNLTEAVTMDVIDHYDLLIEEQNDPFRDPPVLQEYMSKWDGEPFL